MPFFAYVVLGIFVIIAIVLFTGSVVVPNAPANISEDDIRRLARQGQKLQAIKWYRQLHGSSLKSAKEAVEDMLKND